jgi:hypothetical protein
LPIVADTYELVVGVDTHAATHTLAIVSARTGAALEHDTFPATPTGLARMRT